jgi:prephenate dehydrogenase
VTDSKAAIGKLVLIGIGLIGGSLARALKRVNAVEQVVGVARSRDTGDLALELGVIDRFCVDPGEAAEDASIVVIATPLRAFPNILQAIATTLPNDATVTDVGSVKQYVIDAARKYLPEHLERFVPGHPIAGTERSGVHASFSELFERRHVVLTPLPETADAAVSLISDMWKKTGADVITMEGDYHDQLLAATSHLPHVIAYSLVHCLAEHPERDTLFEFAAGGFYDFTRIASSDPVMWRDICMTNRDPILEALREFRSRLDDIVGAVESEDSKRLQQYFAQAKQARDAGLDVKNKIADQG